MQVEGKKGEMTVATIPRPQAATKRDDAERPNTIEEAWDFLRRFAKVEQSWNCDMDNLKIQMTVENEDAEKQVFTTNLEIAPGDARVTAPARLIKVARQAYAFKQQVENGDLFEADEE